MSDSLPTVLEVLRTNCHTIQELEKFCASNKLSFLHPDVVKRKIELSEASVSLDAEFYRNLENIFTTTEELEEAVSLGLDIKNENVKNLHYKLKVINYVILFSNYVPKNIALFKYTITIVQ